MSRFKRGLLGFVVGTILLVLSLYLYLFTFGGLERVLNAQLGALVKDDYKIELAVDDIAGDFLSGISLKNVSVHYVDSTAHYLIAWIPHIEAAYSIRNLWNSEYILEYLYIDSATFSFRKDESGNWLLPDFSPGSASAIPPLAAEDLRLNNASVKIIDKLDTLTINDIFFATEVSIEDGTYSVELKRFEFVSNDEKIVLNTAEGKLTFADGNLLFQDLLLVSDATRLKLDGRLGLIPDLSGDISFSADQVDLEDITKYVGPHLRGVLDLNGAVSLENNRLAGRVDLAGDFMMATFENLLVDFRVEDRQLYIDTVFGTVLGNCAVDGRGKIDFRTKPEPYWLEADIKNFNLKRLVKNSFESDLSGRLRLDGESFSKKSLLLKFDVGLYESSFDEYPLQHASGEITVTVDSLVFGDAFTIDYFENRFYVSGPIVYTDSIDLDIRAHLQQLDRYRNKLFISDPAGRAFSQARLHGLTKDPNLTGFFVSDSIWIYDLFCDSLYSTFDMDRFLTGRTGEVEVDFVTGTVWDIPFDTGYAHLMLDSNIVYFDSTYIFDANSHLSAVGRLDSEAYPRKLNIDTLLLDVFGQPFRNRRPLSIEIDSAGFDFTDATIGNNGAQLAALGRVNYDRSLELDLFVDHVPAGPWINLFEKEWAVDGVVSFNASLGGTLDRPLFELDGSVDSMLYRGLILGDLVTHVKYADQRLTIDSLKINSGSGAYLARGYMHIDLALTSDQRDRLMDRPIEIHFTAEDNRFDLVSLVLPSVEQLDGEFRADVTLSGTPFGPHLQGGAYIRKARLKYFDLENPVFSDSVVVSMSDNRIIIDDVDIYVNEKFSQYELAANNPDKNHHAQLRGEIVVGGPDDFYYDISVDLPEDFPFVYELDDIEGKARGSLHIVGARPPLVSGDLELSSIKYEVNFAEIDEGSPIMAALSGEDTWDLDLNFEIPNGYWIKNDDIEAEFTGELNLIRKNGAYRFIGEMEILRGRGFLFDKTFRLEPGSRVIFEGNETLNPRLDIIGYTWMTLVTSSLTDTEDKSYEQRVVGVHVTGTLENPEINPAEDSEIQNREELLTWLVGGYYSSQQGTAAGSVERRLIGLMSSQVSQIGTKQLGQLGVETFEIDPAYEGQIDLANTRVTAGGYVPWLSDMYVYGRTPLSGNKGQEVGFEYRVSRNVIFEGRTGEDELYRLLLKLHWEFE